MAAAIEALLDNAEARARYGAEAGLSCGPQPGGGHATVLRLPLSPPEPVQLNRIDR
jgi:hypothetical protein